MRTLVLHTLPAALLLTRVLCALASSAQLHAQPQPQPPPLWPLPSSSSSGGGSPRVLGGGAGALSFSATSGDSDELQLAIARYTAIIFARGGHTAAAAAGPTVCRISVAHPVKALGMGTDEGYSLRVPASGDVTINATTTIGAYRALETLSQLIAYDFDHGGRYVIDRVPWAIDDAPRFPWRGLMIDTARRESVL